MQSSRSGLWEELEVYLDRLHAIAPPVEPHSPVSSVAPGEPPVDSDDSLSLSLTVPRAAPALSGGAGTGARQPPCAAPILSGSPSSHCGPETLPTAAEPPARSIARASPHAAASSGAGGAGAWEHPAPGVGRDGAAEGAYTSPAPAPRPRRRLSEASLASVDLNCHSPGLATPPGSVSKCAQSTRTGQVPEGAAREGAGGVVSRPLWFQPLAVESSKRPSGGLLQLLPAGPVQAVPPPPAEEYPYEDGARLGVSFQRARDITDKITPKRSCRGCNCRKSKCLKMYCECFLAKVFCDGCQCVDCLNTADNADAVMRAQKTALRRNPKAFSPKVQHDTQAHFKGCHCKRSFCLKKYCECFQLGVACTDACKCLGCKNDKTCGGPPPSQPSSNESEVSLSDCKPEASTISLPEGSLKSTPSPSELTPPSCSTPVSTPAIAACPPSPRFTFPCAPCKLSKMAGCGTEKAHHRCRKRMDAEARASHAPSDVARAAAGKACLPPASYPARGDSPSTRPPSPTTTSSTAASGATSPAGTRKAVGAGGSSAGAAFASPPPPGASTPSPTRGLNMLAECSLELGQALCTPMTKLESERLCRHGKYHGVTYHKKKRKYLTRLSLPGGKHTHIGEHDEEVAAAQAYDAMTFHLKGHSATFNFLSPSADDMPSGLRGLKEKLGLTKASAENNVDELNTDKNAGRAVEYPTEDDSKTSEVTVTEDHQRSTYNVLNNIQVEAALPVPGRHIRMLSKVVAEKAKRLGVSSVIALCHIRDSTRAMAMKSRNPVVYDLAQKVSTIANRLPPCAVHEQNSDVWRKFNASLMDTCDIAEVASKMSWLQTQTRVMNAMWLANQRPDWVAQCKLLAGQGAARGGKSHAPGAALYANQGAIVKFKELLQSFSRAVNWGLVELLWRAEDSGDSTGARQLVKNFELGKDRKVILKAHMSSIHRRSVSTQTKRKRTPRMSGSEEQTSPGEDGSPTSAEGLSFRASARGACRERRPADASTPTAAETSRAAGARNGGWSVRRAQVHRRSLGYSQLLTAEAGDPQKKTSKYRGVSWHKERSQWLARLYQKGGKYVHLGYFAEEESAARAYDKAVQRILGPSGVLNLGNRARENVKTPNTSKETGDSTSGSVGGNGRDAFSELSINNQRA